VPGVQPRSVTIACCTVAYQWRVSILQSFAATDYGLSVTGCFPRHSSRSGPSTERLLRSCGDHRLNGEGAKQTSARCCSCQTHEEPYGTDGFDLGRLRNGRCGQQPKAADQ
jgi:hypothetical protein